MAKVRKVVGDQSSEEFSTQRRAFNTLLAVLENIGDQVTRVSTPLTAEEGWFVLTATIATGIDNTIINVDGGGRDYTGTGLPLNGVDPTPKHPKRSNVGKVVDLDLKNL